MRAPAHLRGHGARSHHGTENTVTLVVGEASQVVVVRGRLRRVVVPELVQGERVVSPADVRFIARAGVVARARAVPEVDVLVLAPALWVPEKRKRRTARRNTQTFPEVKPHDQQPATSKRSQPLRNAQTTYHV